MGGEFSFSGASVYNMSAVSGATLELKYPKDILRLSGEGSHRAGTMVPERLRNTVYWNVQPNNDYETQDGRLVFGLSSADAWADMNGELAQLEFEVLDASRLAEAELKLTEVELTPDGFDPIAVPGSRLALKSGDEKPLGVDYRNAEAQIMYRVGTNGMSGYVFEGSGMGTNNMGGLERGIAKTGGGGDVQPELVLVEGLTYVFEWQEDELPFYVGTEAGFGNEFEGLELEGNGVTGKGQRVVLMPNAKTPRQLTYYSSPTMSGIIRVVKADAGEVDEGVSLPREGTEEETTDPGEGEQENALPVLAALSDVEL